MMRFLLELLANPAILKERDYWHQQFLDERARCEALERLLQDKAGEQRIAEV